MKYFPWVLLVDYVASMIVAILIAHHFDVSLDVQEFLDLRRQLAGILVLPFLETAMFQWLVFEIIIRFLSDRYPKGALLIASTVSAISFFAAHYVLNGPFNGWSYGLIGGITLAFMYSVLRKNGATQAFFGTWMAHAASNTMLFLSVLLWSKVTSNC